MKQLFVRLVLVASLLEHVRASVCDTVQCQNGGICVEETADYSKHHFIEEIMDFHCQCEPGWTGLACEVPYNSCSSTHMC